MTNNYAVEFNNLSKKYGSFDALENISVKLEPNKIYGLLGRNGAGKTTLLNILSAKIFATSGEAKVFGKPAFENIEILKQICLIEEKGFYEDSVRVWQILELASGLYPNWDKSYADHLLTVFELDKRKKYKQLSRGMESALGLIIGLASRAPLTIFDEPSLGLDAVIRERFYEAVVDDYTEHPRTIIISTHLIDEVSRLFEDIIILSNGKMLLKSNASELREKVFYVSGRESAVREAAKDTIIMNEESFGGTLILSVYSENGLAPSTDVDIQTMPLQKLFIELINPKVHDKLKKGGILQ